ALTGHATAPLAATSWLTWALAAPVFLTIGYGGMRALMALLNQVRDGVFAKVAMHAVRRMAILTFEHMHQLSLRFHLERKTSRLHPRLPRRPHRLQDPLAPGLRPLL